MRLFENRQINYKLRKFFGVFLMILYPVLEFFYQNYCTLKIKLFSGSNASLIVVFKESVVLDYLMMLWLINTIPMNWSLYIAKYVTFCTKLITCNDFVFEKGTLHIT